MTDSEIKKQFELSNAIVSACWNAGLKPLQDAELKILEHLTSLGVVADIGSGYLRLHQGTTEIAPSPALQEIRKQFPAWFVPQPKDADQIVSLEDFSKSTSEGCKERSAFIAKYGLAAFSSLPKTRAEAELRSTPPSASMSRAAYLALDLRSKSRLAGLIGVTGIEKIMSRTR